MESLAVFLRQKGFENEIVNCLEGMVEDFLIFLYFFENLGRISSFPALVYQGCISM